MYILSFMMHTYFAAQSLRSANVLPSSVHVAPSVVPYLVPSTPYVGGESINVGVCMCIIVLLIATPTLTPTPTGILVSGASTCKLPCAMAQMDSDYTYTCSIWAHIFIIHVSFCSRWRQFLVFDHMDSSFAPPKYTLKNLCFSLSNLV